MLCQICGLEETNLGLLSATAAAGDQRLRQETILVTLEKGVVTIDDWHGRVAKWLGTVDFGLLRQADMTAHLTGYDAVRRLHINNCYADGSMEIAKFNDLREFILTDWSGRVFRDISYPEYSDLDLPGLGEGWTVERILRCVLAARTLKHFALHITENPHKFRLVWNTDFENGRLRLTEWLSGRFKAGGSDVQVSVRPVVCF